MTQVTIKVNLLWPHYRVNTQERTYSPKKLLQNDKFPLISQILKAEQFHLSCDSLYNLLLAPNKNELGLIQNIKEGQK